MWFWLIAGGGGNGVVIGIIVGVVVLVLVGAAVIGVFAFIKMKGGNNKVTSEGNFEAAHPAPVPSAPPLVAPPAEADVSVSPRRAEVCNMYKRLKWGCTVWISVGVTALVCPQTCGIDPSCNTCHRLICWLIGWRCLFLDVIYVRNVRYDSDVMGQWKGKRMPFHRGRDYF